MRISLTGSSSTGKTTLAIALLKDRGFRKAVNKFIYVDGRELLREMGCQSMNKMSMQQQKEYQLRYYRKKIEKEENLDNYITDRSFVDIAAYWLTRDTFDQSVQEQELLISPCKKLAMKYDYTFYLPSGSIEFEKDGYRPEDFEFNKAIDKRIKLFLDEWGIEYYKIWFKSLDERVKYIVETINTNTRTS
jgi:predicted ATPase